MKFRANIFIAGLISAFVLTTGYHQDALAQKSLSTTNATNSLKTQNLLENWQKRLDDIETFFKNPDLTDADLSVSRKVLITIDSELQKLLRSVRPELAKNSARILKLGPPPKKGAPPENETAAADRKRLNGRITTLRGTIKSAEVLIVRAQQLHQVTRERRRSLFSGNLFKYTGSPLLPGLWARAVKDFSNTADRFQTLITSWWNKVPVKQNIIMLAILSIALWIGSTIFSLRWHQYIRHQTAPSGHDFLSKAVSALLATILRTASIIISLTFFYQGLVALDVMTPSVQPLIFRSTVAIGEFVAVVSLASSLFALNNPQWRVFSTSDQSSQRLFWLTFVIAGLYSLEQITAAIYLFALAPLSVTIIQNCIISLIFAVLLIGLLRTPWLERRDNESASLAVSLPWINKIVWMLPAAIIIASLGGYIAFAQFLTSQVVITGSILIASYLIFLTINSFTQSFIDEKTPVGLFVAKSQWAQEKRIQLLSLAFNAILKLLLLAFSVPPILLQWGFNQDDLRDWLNSAVNDIQIGEFKISIASILLAIFLLIAGLIITRFAQKWVDRNLEQSLSVKSSGISHSIRTGVGYLGFVLSLLVAASYLGVNFTNIALIAGALSVGIGFGLQSIVNNFVSGLILLIERPVKVGDWIVVGQEQGYVHRINVRSTEIETFDRSILIIPNSELITGTVTNWTHRNSVGRVVINVGVSYNSDPQQVYDLLMELACSHPDVVDEPKPRVVFENFGESSLDFSVRVYVADISQSGLLVRTGLRIQIIKAFRAARIEIPYPQRDLHIKQDSSPTDKKVTKAKILEFMN